MLLTQTFNILTNQTKFQFSLTVLSQLFGFRFEVNFFISTAKTQVKQNENITFNYSAHITRVDQRVLFLLELCADIQQSLDGKLRPKSTLVKINTLFYLIASYRFSSKNKKEHKERKRERQFTGISTNLNIQPLFPRVVCRECKFIICYLHKY